MVQLRSLPQHDSLGQLFDPGMLKEPVVSRLPSSVEQRAIEAATFHLHARPRCTRSYPDEDREIIFDRGHNRWEEWRGSVRVTVTAEDVAFGGARNYLDDRLGIDPANYRTHLSEIATGVARGYAATYASSAVAVHVWSGELEY